jgi:1,4-alpha-glucan branching enzyme
MIHKTFIQANGQQVAQTTFIVPKSTRDETLYLVGDFNDWNTTSHPFQQDYKDRWTLTVNLEVGRAYQFRYLRDGQEWMQDSQADAYVYNPRSYHNFVVVTDPNFTRYDG